MSRTPVTVLLLVGIGVGYMLELAAGGPTNPHALYNLGAIVNGIVQRGDYWRLVAAMFLHGGFLHLALNGWALFQLGFVFERLFGSGRFLVTYFVSGIIASTVSSFFIPIGVPGIGASGAIFGILGALIVAIRRSPALRHQHWAKALTRQLMIWAAINIVIGFTIPGIDNNAHLGGFFSGLLLGFLPHRVPPPPPSQAVIDVDENRPEEPQRVDYRSSEDKRYWW